MIYFVLAEDGHVKGYPDQAAAEHCAKCDGGKVYVAQEVTPEAPAAEVKP